LPSSFKPAETTIAPLVPAFGELGDELWHGGRRRADDGEIGRHRQMGDIGIGKNAADGLVLRINGHDRRRKPGGEQVARRHRSDRAGAIAGSATDCGWKIASRLRVDIGVALPALHSILRKRSCANEPNQQPPRAQLMRINAPGLAVRYESLRCKRRNA
jgi:hypothetical protein